MKKNNDKETNILMQRIYGKTNMKEKELYELRDPQPLNTERHPDAYKIAQRSVTQSSQSPAQSQPQAQQRPFTIPSSSHLIEPEPSAPIRSYVPSRPVYFHESPSSPPHEVYTSPRNLHCVVIADHIVDCPICSRFYRNYSPLYNGIIIVLVIILVVILFKNRSPVATAIMTATPQQATATLANTFRSAG